MIDLRLLPNEIVLEIATHLPTPSLNELLQTSRWVNELLIHTLYKRSTAIETEDQDYAMIWAVKHNNVSALKKLVPYNKANMATAAMRMAVGLGDEEALEILLNGGADPSYPAIIIEEENVPQHRMLRFPLFHASSCGHLRIVKRLIAVWPHLMKGSAGTQYTAQTTFTPVGTSDLLIAFHGAIVNQHNRVAEFIYRETKLIIPPDAGPKLFRYILARPNVEGLKFLYLNRHDFLGFPDRYCEIDPSTNCYLAHRHEFFNFKGRRPLPSSVDIAHLLIDWGADLEANGPRNRKPLHYAVHTKYMHLAECLLQRGAQVDALDSQGKSPLMLAVADQDLDLSKLLIRYGADVNLRDQISQSVLHYAIICQDVDVTLLLIQHGADLDALNGIGTTPIHYAIMLRSRGITNVLIEHGARVDIADHRGRTAGYLIARAGWVGIVRLLEQREQQRQQRQRQTLFQSGDQ